MVALAITIAVVVVIALLAYGLADALPRSSGALTPARRRYYSYLRNAGYSHGAAMRRARKQPR